MFKYPAPFVGADLSGDGVLSKDGVDWLVKMLQSISNLEIDSDLCQEDWGVAIFAKRNQKQFWIGVGCMQDDQQSWLVHIHHGSLAWLQRFSRSGRDEFRKLVSDFHQVLSNDKSVSKIEWYTQKQMIKGPFDGGSPTPD